MGIGRNESLVGCVGRKSLTLRLPRQVIALDLLVEIAARHVQGARRLGHVPVMFFQLREQIGALGGLLELLERGRPHPRRSREIPAASRVPRPARSGGISIGTTLSRKYRSSRNRPAAISTETFLFVAAITRTSTRSAFPDPTRDITPSSRARSTFACAARLMSPISSRNSVPPSASSNFPSRSANAPVKLPFMWPNSSLSISSPGIAAQFTSTNGPWARGDSAWIARA